MAEMYPTFAHTRKTNYLFFVFFTFLHLTAAFIRSDLPCITIHAFPGTQTHDLAIAGTMQHKALPSIDKRKTLMQSGFTG